MKGMMKRKGRRYKNTGRKTKERGKKQGEEIERIKKKEEEVSGGLRVRER